MFRYGGPIKEGVMSGIREPKKNGGSMGNLVGSPAYPKTDGREHHFAVSGTIAGMAGLNALRHGAMRLGARYLLRMWQGAKRMFGTTTPASVTRGVNKTIGPINYSPVTMNPAKFNPNWLGRDPLIATGGKIIQGVMSPTSKGIVQKAARIVLSPTGVATGLIYAGGKFFDGDGNEVPPPNGNVSLGGKVGTSGAPGGGDPNMRGDGSWFDAQAKKEALAKEQKDWNNRIKKYRDIMDIKGMNKQAAYKSLVDASKLIQDSQDFKGDIRSGKLINQVIQAASKQFDKPAKTSDAINSLILQNELKKDLSAETDALDKLYKQGRIAVDQKALNPSKSDLVGAYAKSGVKGQALYDNAAKELSANSGQTWRGNLIEDSKFKEILTELKKNPKTKNADDVSIIATWTQGELDSMEKNIPDGNYTVGSTIVTIQDKQVVDVN